MRLFLQLGTLPSAYLPHLHTAVSSSQITVATIAQYESTHTHLTHQSSKIRPSTLSLPTRSRYALVQMLVYWYNPTVVARPHPLKE